MKTKLLNSMRALLVAAAMLTGTNAWAGTSTIFSQVSWSHTHDGGSGDRSSALSFDGTSSIDDNWAISFDVTTSSTNSRTNGTRNFQIALLSASASSYPSNAVAVSNVLLGAKFATTNNTDYSSFPCTITVNDVDEAETVTLSHNTKYTFSVSVEGTSMTVSIKNGSTSVFTKATTLAAFVKPKGIYDLLPRPYNKTWGVYTNTYSDILLTKEVNVEEVTAPTISVVYTGANRTITIKEGASSESNTVTTYYTTDGTDPTAESTEYTGLIVANADCTIKAITISSAGTSSEIASENVTVGVLTLNAPSLTKTAYADGKYTVNISNSQTNLAYPPASVTTYYRIGTTGDYTAGESVSVPAGETLFAYIAADNYTSSEIITCATAVRPILSQTWIQDYTQATSASGNGAYGIVLSGTEGGDFTVGETPFYNIAGYTFNNATVSTSLNTNVGLNTAKNFSLRCNANNSGILQNGSVQYIGIQNLNIGDYIIITTNGNSLGANEGVTLKTEMSTTSEYIFEVTATEASITFYNGTYNYVKTISVNSVVTSVSVTLPTTSDYASLASAYGLDFSSVDGLTAYVATATTTEAVTLTSVSELPAGQGVILKGTAGDTYSIPMKADATYAGTNLLSAAVTATPIEANAAYILQGGQFHLVTKASTVPAGKAYLLKTNVPSSARALGFIFDDETTGIGATLVNNGIVNNEIYNLNGQRVAAPTKGLYIVGGRKVVVK